MIEKKGVVLSVNEIQKNIFILKIKTKDIAANAKPGQFCNIRVSNSFSPLLRRPFSVCEVGEDWISFQFALVGIGTKILSEKKEGDVIDLIGPLGNGFDLSGDYKNAVIIAGGVGTAPFPFLINSLSPNINITTLVGGRTKEDVINYKMNNLLVATDDGSDGFHGNVVQLFDSIKDEYTHANTRIYACGPNPMLRALSKYCIENNYECQISTESSMACGFGICQGCNVEGTHSDRFLLVCKDGPVFNAEDVKL